VRGAALSLHPTGAARPSQRDDRCTLVGRGRGRPAHGAARRATV